MSHFSRIKTRLEDLSIIQKALTDLNYPFQTGQKIAIRGYDHKTYQVDLAIPMGNGYDIGLKKNVKTGSYDVIADWYGIALEPEEFANSLQQRYAYHKIMQEAERHGLMISENDRLADGSIRLVVRQWA